MAIAALALPPVAARAAAPSCPAGACVSLDGAKDVRSVSHVAAGLTASVEPGLNDDQADLASLDTQMYRSSPSMGVLGYNWGGWSEARSRGAKTTLILSNLWAEQAAHGVPPTPWSNWAAYSSWVSATTRKILSSREPVTYWEVYNEPGWEGYYSSADFASMTPADLLQQFLVAYQAIKAVDPGAQIVGPSIGLFATSPLPANDWLTREPDINTFLNFCVQHHLHLAAVAVHQNGATPAQVSGFLGYTKRAVADRPALGHPLVYLDEYASAITQPIPGWDVGFISAIEYSGASLASRSCWSDCNTGDLDGLLLKNGSATGSTYFVRQTYAAMSGQIVSQSSTKPTVVIVGSVNTASHRMVALVGRDASCVTASWCRNGWPSGSRPAGPMSVRVNLIVPWTSGVSVALSDEPFAPGSVVNGPSTAIPSDLSVQRHSSGSDEVSFTIPRFTDGTAYNVVVSGT